MNAGFKTSQLLTLILVGIFAVLVGLVVGLFGAAEWASTDDPVGPLSGVVQGHVEKNKEVASGNRGQRREVKVTEIEVAYSLDGSSYTFTVDRNPELARSEFPIGQKLKVYRFGNVRR